VSGVRRLLGRKPPAGRSRQPQLPPRQPDEPLRIAAITFCRDEGRMLPLWIRYYGGQFGVENLYVVDDNSEDGSTDDLACNVLHIPPIRGGKFESTRMKFLAGLAASLRTLYDCVVFTDVDEFVVPDPARHSGLKDFIVRQGDDRPAVAALGLNVVHVTGTEPPLDLSAPVLSQRSFAKFVPVMCKPSVNFAGAPWFAASHGIRAPYAVDPDLWMFHLKYADRELLREAADHRLRMVEADGRSRETQWGEGSETLVGLLDQITADVDPAGVPEFRPPTGRALADLVVQAGPGRFRAPKGAQMQLMETQPLVRIPDRFHGTV
jgi:Glycosyl transferase family 2